MQTAHILHDCQLVYVLLWHVILLNDQINTVFFQGLLINHSEKMSQRIISVDVGLQMLFRLFSSSTHHIQLTGNFRCTRFTHLHLTGQFDNKFSLPKALLIESVDFAMDSFFLAQAKSCAANPKPP